jgi:uncharacterized protein (DUF1800 family)
MRTGWATPRLLVVLAVVTGLSWGQRGLGTLQITAPTMAVQVGGSTTTLSAQRAFFRAPNRTLPVSARWYSSDPTIATVDIHTGMVTPVAAGTITVTAISGPFVSKTVVEVVPTGAVTALAIASPDSSIAKGLTEQYTATATIAGNPVDVTAVASWSSTIASVAPINTAGLAKGMAVGGPTSIQASLTVGATTVSSNQLPLTVGPAVLQFVTVSPSPIFMGANTTLQLIATGHWTDGDRNETNNATWVSSDTTNVATISNTGLLTGIGIGGSHIANTGTITMTLNPLPAQNIPISVMTAAEAGRFLEQATFGPSPADVAHLQSIGFDAWLTEQFGLSQGYSQYPAAPDIPTVQNQFYFNALTAPDQLRQRAAFALEQIWVISSNKVSDPNAFVPWQNMMERDAFGNYRSLMYDVTLSPAMGVYLDMVNNDKPAGNPPTNPNENYARELLQLFTIGLYQLDSTGAQVLDGNNNPIPTYNESVVQGFAHVFTGWTFPTKPGQILQKHNPAYYGPSPYGSPMENLASNHDTTNTKLLLNAVTLPAGQTAQQDLNAALDNIFQDTTLPPFVCKQLIEHLVKSNPSANYVTDVVNVFNNDGNNVRGNLQAVIKAILMDPEARAGDFQVFPLGTDPKEGHLREPVLFMTSVERSLSSTDTGTSLEFQGSTMGQDILNSPTVFNFYPPDYVIPQNYFSPAQMGVVGPEFALETPTTAVSRANFVASVVFGSLSPSISATVNSLKPLAGSNPPNALVDALNLRLMHGQMSSGMRTDIINAVSFYSTTSTTTRVQTAIYLILSSSQYQVQH